MRHALIALSLALPLTACAGDYYGGGVGYGGGYYGAPSVAYNGFYDNYYGPFYDGYWGRGDVFWYRAHPNGRFIRDRGRHFVRGGGPDFRPRPGFSPFHGAGPGPRGFRGGGHRGPGHHR